MSNSRRTMVFVIALLCAITLLACELGSVGSSSQPGTGSPTPAGSGQQQPPSGGQPQPPSGGQAQPPAGGKPQPPSGGQAGQTPTAPANLRVTATTKTTARLAWDDKSNNEDGFEINFPGKQNPKTGPNETQWEITGLECGKAYNFQVRAFNAAGNSTYSNEVTAQTVACSSGGSASVPAAPSNLAVTGWTKDSVKLAWKDNSNNEDGFEIVVSDIQNVKTGPNVTQWEVTGLKCGKTYTIRVRAFNAAGNSGFSNELTAQTAACEVLGIPTAPSDLKITSWTKESVKLTWKDNSNNEDGFEIAVEGVKDPTTGPNVTQYEVTNLKCGVNYNFRVRAFNAQGKSEYSNAVPYARTVCP